MHGIQTGGEGMSRKCPYCGEEVPSFSINCPKCYKDLPREEKKEPKEDKKKGPIPNDRAPSVRIINMKLVLVLALIPAALGIMGMGQMYEGYYRKGVFFLVIGLIIFIPLVLLIANIGYMGGAAVFGVIGIIFLLIMFIIAYAVQAFDAIIRSIIPVSLKF